MNVVDSDLFARLMSLSDGTRHDLLDFLGAGSVDEDQLDKMIDDLSNSIEERRRQRMLKTI